MQKLDTVHAHAIYNEIGERIRAQRLETDLPVSIEDQLHRLQDLDEEAPSIVPTAANEDDGG
jgi:hypothetical protein